MIPRERLDEEIPADSVADPLIHLEGVDRSYSVGDAKVHAVNGVDLSVWRRDFAAIWGPSGSGKTTLLNIIGLIDKPSSGRILVAGEDVAAKTDAELSDFRNRHVGFVFQHFSLIPVLTAVENVMMPLEIAGLPRQEARKRAMQSLTHTGLEQLANFNVERLSGGQRQRVAVSRALVARPSIVVADEPTANLDSATSADLITLMQQINQETGVTFIFSTHDPRLLERVPRHIGLRDGCVCSDRRTEPGAQA